MSLVRMLGEIVEIIMHHPQGKAVAEGVLEALKEQVSKVSSQRSPSPPVSRFPNRLSEN